MVVAGSFPSRRRPFLDWLTRLLGAVGERPPLLGCAGLHEWAMVYRTTDRRHPQVPLRVRPEVVEAVVEARPILCTHHDAFRFFTPAARPLSLVQPGRERTVENEQPGCLHVNMDLYRWAAKLHPWVDSDLLASTFLLAWRIREVDMRASPYDLRAWGHEPIPVETEAGRKTYREAQLAFSEEAGPLRERLLEIASRLLEGCSDEPCRRPPPSP